MKLLPRRPSHSALGSRVSFKSRITRYAGEQRGEILIELNRCRLDGLNDGICRFLSDEQRSRMRTRSWVFLDEEDDVVSLVPLPRL